MTGESLRLGWIGAGRMGQALAGRLLDASQDLTVYNRTRSKCDALEERGAKVVDSPVELADRDLVFTMVAADEDFKEVVLGPNGLLANPDVAPRLLVDSTTISAAAAAMVRASAEERGVAVIAAPVSGNPKVAAAGRLTIVASGPADAFAQARPTIELLCSRVTYVGEGERARLVKICHNLMLGVVAQTLAEVTLLAQKGGVARADFLAFLNDSVMGSTFTRYKTPAYVNLDFTPSFTPALLLKDFQLGISAADELGGLPMPVVEAARDVVAAVVDGGEYDDVDFAVLIEVLAEQAGMELVSESVQVDDGLEPPAAASEFGTPSDTPSLT
jgi:3-hydroxyisobutyrate dehydrogenase-like beta-hydroxyacid dehydrogenase